MKVKIGPYLSPFGTRELAYWLCRWAKPVQDEHGILDKPKWVYDFAEWLTYGSVKQTPERKPGDIYSLGQETRKPTLLYNFLLWIDSKRSRTVRVKIDSWDTWNMNATLAHIILPMLKQLKENKQGIPLVDDEDVPQELRSTTAPPKKNEWDVDDNHFKRWEWVIDQMIFAFESLLDDSWEEQFVTGKEDFQLQMLEDGSSQLIEGPNHTYKVDLEGSKQYQNRITNGFRLFGKYYEALWS